MKRFIWLSILICTGCKETVSEESTADIPPGQAKKLIETAGCTVAKNKGTITITCADQSASSFETAPVISTYYVRDAVQEYTNLRVLSVSMSEGHRFYNTVTGNILGYSGQGALIGISSIYFDAAGCTGNMFTNYPGALFGNQVFPNQSGMPGYSGFTVEQANAGVTVHSVYVNGACSATSVGGNYHRLTSINYNEQAPAQMTAPISIMSQ